MPIKIVERQLRRTSEQIASLRAELFLLDEQWAHLSDEADTARLYALVSETPISERTHQRAARCLLYTSPSPRDVEESRMPSSA